MALAKFKRQALHAVELTLSHPTSHKLLSFTAPLPVDFADLLQKLSEDNRT